jgi:hypothetical protein
VPKEVERVKKLAPDRFCRVGAEQMSADAGDACVDYLLDETIKDSKSKSLDPHLGLSGEGIREALSNKELIPDVNAVFKNNKQRIRAEHFNLLLKWHKKHLMGRLFNELNQIGIRKKIGLADIIPELNEVFSSFSPTQPFNVFLESLKQILKGKIQEVNERVS